MRPRGVKWLVVLCLVLVAGCTAEPSAPSAPSADPPRSSAPTVPSVPSASPSPSVSPPRMLDRVRVTRDGADLRVSFPKPRATHPPDVPSGLRHLIAMRVAALRPARRVVIGGGDGATLLPFQRLAVSQEYDDWSVTDLPRFDDEMAYVSGAVLLPDGRLVALLDHFSDDRGGHPSDRHHGLWTSIAGDLTSYRPLEPRFSPPVPDAPDGWGPLVSLGGSLRPDPVVWAATWDRRLYVSTDGARTFRELDVT